jgi:uncharacterized protein (TIGR04255 family)
MATHNKALPEKLRHDAIIEAVFEVRFDMTMIPEIFFGQLAEYEPWKRFEQQRMPAYAIPTPLRQADLNLRFQPVFELREAKGHRSVRIGANVFSYHLMFPYIGGDEFMLELSEAIDILFKKAKGLNVRRLGFRYINALIPDIHGIRSISALDLKLAIAGESVSNQVNINFTKDLSVDTLCTVRIATPDFVQGTLPPNTVVMIDVDVFTKESFRTKENTKVKRWVEYAHAEEKKQFFRLLTDETIDFLKEN